MLLPWALPAFGGSTWASGLGEDQGTRRRPVRNYSLLPNFFWALRPNELILLSPLIWMKASKGASLNIASKGSVRVNLSESSAVTNSLLRYTCHRFTTSDTDNQRVRNPS